MAIKDLFDLWQMNMINCCNFELTYLPLEGKRMMMILPDGKHILQVGKMLRQDKRCYTFVVENTNMLCGGHPKWDPKKPGLNEEGFHWDVVNAEKGVQDRKKKVDMWKKPKKPVRACEADNSCPPKPTKPTDAKTDKAPKQSDKSSTNSPTPPKKVTPKKATVPSTGFDAEKGINAENILAAFNWVGSYIWAVLLTPIALGLVKYYSNKPKAKSE